ncbi:hypothetical protein WICPIJ_007244 [Wickerhamomyces pijperi]|uniref:Transcription elongation factor 1 homolog n=1 Tax=Wickerhamomyces pijperi TaxID=599730 RepID=A0A9P8Q213_WICPI|nr:hypothetical protein WICPIJ_007244 [Wickerhamomyces pijperi]
MSSAKPVKKVVQKLDTSFNCLFCNHEKSIICTLDKKNNLGTLYCKICGQSFQTTINALSKPVDVYTDWYDAVEEVNKDNGDEYSDDEDAGSDGEGNLSRTNKFIDDDEEEEDDGDYSE